MSRITVYVLISTDPDCIGVIGVYASREEAIDGKNDFIEEMGGDMDWYDSKLSISEHTLLISHTLGLSLFLF